MTNVMTKNSDYQPTPAMRVWLDSAIELLTDNITEISKHCKVTRQSWYEWSKDPDFLRWFRGEWKVRLSSFGWRLDVIGLQKARENVSYWRSMQERIGNLPNKEPVEDPVWRLEIVDYKAEQAKKEAEGKIV